MKIAILIHNFYPFIGGAEVYAQELAEYAVRRGNEVHVITLKSRQDLKSDDVINGVFVHRLGARKRKYVSFFMDYLRAWKCFSGLSKKGKFDILHVVDSLGIGFPSSMGYFLKIVKKTPYIVTVQGWDSISVYPNNIVGKLGKFRQGIGIRHADLVHAISREVNKQVEKLGARKIKIVPNGFDARVFKPLDKAELRKEYGIPADTKIIIAVGRLIERKGMQYLVQAFPIVAKQVPGLRLLIIGDGDFRPQLEEQIKTAGIGNAVKIYGLIPHNKIAEYLNMADIFVIPSVYEPLGIVTIEAMACGIPAIGSNVEGIPDIIQHDMNGLLVPPADPEALAVSLINLLKDEETMKRFSQEGLKTVIERFSWESVLSRVEQDYIDLIRQSNS